MSKKLVVALFDRSGFYEIVCRSTKNTRVRPRDGGESFLTPTINLRWCHPDLISSGGAVVEKQQEIEVLRSQIEQARDSYYSDGTSQLTDEESDALEDRLSELSPSDPVLQKVGSATLTGNWPTKAHNIPMGSLNKIRQGAEGINEWWKNIESQLGPKDDIV